MSLSALRHALAQRSEITTLTVYHIDSYISTRVTIPRSKIETFSHVEVHHITSEHEITSVLNQIEAGEAVPASGETEYRWKLVFSDRHEHRLLEVYAAAFGPAGMIGEQAVHFHSAAFTDWLRKHYAPSEPAPAP